MHSLDLARKEQLLPSLDNAPDASIASTLSKLSTETVDKLGLDKLKE
jgi:hypothetical protein